MARYLGSTSKVSRRLGVAITSKDQVYMDRRPYAPGQHGQSRRRKLSEYSIQLREKQKMKHIYGVLEKQFWNYYKKASSQRGITGDNLIKLLERRLDNAVFRSGFSTTRPEARQLVSHGHILINDNKVNIPSYKVSPGDVISFRAKSSSLASVKNAIDMRKDSQVPSWIQLDKSKRQAVFLNVPEREEVQEQFNEKLVVELYSK